MFSQIVSNLVISDIYSAIRFTDSPIGVTNTRRNRDAWAIALKTEGKTIYKVGGKEILSDKTHPVILPKGCDYTWRCIERGECIIIDFDADITHNDFESFNKSDTTLIVGNFAKIEKALNRKSRGYKLECFYLLYEIIAFLLKDEAKSPAHPKILRTLSPAVKYMSESYSDGNITNDFLAGLCTLSTVYFRKSFVKLYGISPMKYLHNLRIEKAKAILRSDYDSIEQVAASVGYNSIFHFSKSFKIHTGKTPSEYSSAAHK